MVSGKAAGGALSAPTTSKAKEAGLNMLVDIAKAVARTKSDPAAAQRAIGKFTQTDDRKVIDETYDFYAPSWVTSLALRPEQFQTWFGYLDDTEYPLVKKAEPKDFYDNSFGES